MCPNFYNISKCTECAKGALKLDLSHINGYQQGEIIMGNLGKLYWIVLRSIDVNNDIQSDIRSIADKGNWLQHFC